MVVVVSFLLFGGAGGPSCLPLTAPKPPIGASYTSVQGSGAFTMCEHMLHQSCLCAVQPYGRTHVHAWGYGVPGPPFPFSIDSSLPLPRIKTSVCTTWVFLEEVYDASGRAGCPGDHEQSSWRSGCFGDGCHEVPEAGGCVLGAAGVRGSSREGSFASEVEGPCVAAVAHAACGSGRCVMCSMAGARRPSPGQMGREACLMKGPLRGTWVPPSWPWMTPPATRISARERVRDRGSG